MACGSGGGGDNTIGDGGGTDTSIDNHQPPNDSGKDTSPGMDATNDSPTTGCGTCPTGYACGTANGIPVCRSMSTSIPLFQNVYVILMENTSLSTLKSAMTGGTAPNLKGWAAAYATASNYQGVGHPSLPNYIALTSGGTQGIGCDCGATPGGSTCSPACNFCFTCSCDVPSTVKHLGDQLEAASKTWMDFGEDMGTACNMTDSGNYASRHNPFLYYDNVQTPSSRCTSHVVDFGMFNPASPANFNFIAPNLNNDMHSAPIATGDTWLGIHAGAILASSAYKAGGLLVIVWDEDDGSGGLCASQMDTTPVGLFLFSPYAKSAGYVSPTAATHYSLLATFEDGLGVGRLGSAGTAKPLTDFFPAN
jgi:hypothetical protein